MTPTYDKNTFCIICDNEMISIINQINKYETQIEILKDTLKYDNSKERQVELKKTLSKRYSKLNKWKQELKEIILLYFDNWIWSFPIEEFKSPKESTLILINTLNELSLSNESKKFIVLRTINMYPLYFELLDNKEELYDLVNKEFS